MIFYAIREKSTGYYLPQVRSGFTRTEPEKDCVPRLHKSKKIANACLVQWLQGYCFLKTRSYSYDDYEQEFEIEAKPERKKENIEICELVLVDIPSLILRYGA